MIPGFKRNFLEPSIFAFTEKEQRANGETNEWWENKRNRRKDWVRKAIEKMVSK